MKGNLRNKAVIILLYSLSIGCSAYTDNAAIYDRYQPRTNAEISFAKHTLNKAQTLSFQNNVEYCGYIGVDKNGGFTHTPFTKGKKSYCKAQAIDDEFIILASFHTHGTYSEDHESEIPSSDDLKADIMEGLDGYISTPGGRLWYSDAETKSVRLICNEACVKQDVNYEPFPETVIEQSYTLEQLVNFES